jgi:hypothetical protein
MPRIRRNDSEILADSRLELDAQTEALREEERSWLPLEAASGVADHDYLEDIIDVETAGQLVDGVFDSMVNGPSTEMGREAARRRVQFLQKRHGLTDGVPRTAEDMAVEEACTVGNIHRVLGRAEAVFKKKARRRFFFW